MSKKDIQSLISGIAGKEPQINSLLQATPTGELPKETAEALGIDEELQEKLNAVRRAKVGRPKRSVLPVGREHRATFIVDKEIIRKVKYISLMQSRLLKDIIADALNTYIEGWEKENGKIDLK